MAISSDDIDDVYNKVAAEMDQWLNDAYAAFQKGPAMRAADTVWNQQPEGMKQAARQQVPAAAALLDNLRKPRAK